MRWKPARQIAAIGLAFFAAGCATGGGEASGDQAGALARFEVTGAVRTLAGLSGPNDAFRLQFIDTGLDLLTRGEDRVMRSFTLAWDKPFSLSFDYFWTARGAGPRRPEITVEVGAPGCPGIILPVRLDRVERSPEGAYRIDLMLEMGACD